MNHVKNKDATANIRVDDFLAAHGGGILYIATTTGTVA